MVHPKSKGYVHSSLNQVRFHYCVILLFSNYTGTQQHNTLTQGVDNPELHLSP